MLTQRPLTQMSEKVHSSMSAKEKKRTGEEEEGAERRRETSSCERLIDDWIKSSHSHTVRSG